MYSVKPEEQIMDDHDCFLQEIESKVRDQGLTNEKLARCADKLEQNKPQIKQYLVNNNWTKTHMTSQWFTNKWGETCYGSQTENDLINTRGVCIHPDGSVFIADWDQDSNPTEPNIYCDKYEFKIYE